MEVLKAIGQYVDNLWSLLTIPTILIFTAYFFYFLPIPTFLIVAFCVFIQLDRAEFYLRLYNLHKDDPDLLRCHRTQIGKAIILTVCSAAMYILFGYWTIKTGELCKDLRGVIPGTMAAIMQYLVPHTC